MSDWRRDVLTFWFGQTREQWFNSDPALDAEITERFHDLYERKRELPAASFLDDPLTALAAIILFDQFPRNMFRGDGRTHAADGAALESSRYAVEHALDRELPAFQRMFLYMPFMHSENREDQRRSVELFGLLADEPGAPDVTSYAAGHRDIVERFGRFPHRNGILGRETTPEEAEFLKTEGSSF